MNKSILLLLLTAILFSACKKRTEDTPDPLIKKWYLYQLERYYTDKDGNPSKDFQSYSDVVDDRDMYMEFTHQGQLLTYDGNGTYTRTNDKITLTLGQETQEYQYSFKQDMLVLVENTSGTTFNQKATYTLKPY